MLTIQRQVIGEFVDQPARDETDVGTAGLDHTGGRAGTGDGLGLFDLDHRAPVLEHDVAAGALGQSVALLVTDDREGVRSQPLGFGRGQFDHFDRHPRLVEEGDAVFTGVGLVRRRAPGVGRDGARGRRGRLAWVDELAQAHRAAAAFDDAPLALLTEELAAEPVDLRLECLDLLAQIERRAGQIDDLLRVESPRLIEAEQTRRDRRIHARIIP